MRRASILLALAVAALACGPAPPAPPAVPDFTTRPDARRFRIIGRVVSVAKADRQVTLAHEEIAGFMDAMTMPFTLREAADLDRLAPGDLVEATLVVDGARAWIEGLRITRDPRGVPDAATPRGTWVPAAPGVPMPDVALVDARGHAFRTGARFAGVPLVLAFTYTRCPLPELCPLLMQRLSAIERAIAAAAERGAGAGSLARVQLLTVTLDPGFDTPERLAAYGAVHVTGTPHDRFARWTLATGAAGDVRLLAAFAGLDFYQSEGRINHSLRLAIIDPGGRMVRTFEHRTWTVDEVIAVLRMPPAVS